GLGEIRSQIMSWIVDGLLLANWSSNRRGAKAAEAVAANTQALFDALPEEAKQRAYQAQQEREREQRRRSTRNAIIWAVILFILGGIVYMPKYEPLTAEKALAIEADNARKAARK